MKTSKTSTQALRPSAAPEAELLDAKGLVVATGKASRENGTRKGMFQVEGNADLDAVSNNTHAVRWNGQEPLLIIRAQPNRLERGRLDLIFSVMA